MYEVECPYCGVMVDIDLTDCEDGCFDEECPDCEEEFEVEVEYEPSLSASKIVYETCDCCKKSVRDFARRGSRYPYPKNPDFNILCDGCFTREYWRERDEEKM